MEKFLVIGSNSFSGSHFVAHALKQGTDVVGISRSSEPADALLAYKWGPHDRFRFHQLDINYDLDQIMAVAESFQPHYVVNFAAQGMVAQSWEHPEHWFMTNMVSMVKLHDRLRICPFLKKYVQASTPEVYGSTSGLVKEDARYNPSTPYAVSKAACDMSLMAFHRTYGFPVVFTRAANVCGPGQPLYRIIPKTILSILTGRKLKLEGGGTSARSFIHVGDVCEATWLAATRGLPGSVYHLATDRIVTIRELVELICRQMGVRFADCVEVAPARRGQDSAYLLDCSKARQELDWQPRISLEQTIAETVEWVQANLGALKGEPSEYVHKP